MKKILFSAITALALCSCSSDDNVKDDLGFIDDFETMYEELEIKHSSGSDDVDRYLKYITSKKKAASRISVSDEEAENANVYAQAIKTELAGLGYQKTIINYPSVDALGNQVTLSGAIYMAEDHADTFNEILLYCHQTITANDEAPSGDETLLTLETSVVSKLPNTVIFSSDYVGFGTSKSYNHPYMNNSLAARNQIDMLKAGLTYLKDKGYKIKTAQTGLNTYVFGYSQGGGVALATTKAIESDTQLASNVNFKGSLCGDGPYDLGVTFDKFIKDGKMTMPIVLPYVLIGMYESYPDVFKGINMYDYLSQKCKTGINGKGIIEYIESKPSLVSALETTEDSIGNSLDVILSDSAKNMNSTIMKKLYTTLDKQNQLDGSWTPAHQVVFYHSNQDDVVSYENATKAIKTFNSSNCSLSPLPNNMTHAVEYIHFTKECITNCIFRVDQ